MGFCGNLFADDAAMQVRLETGVARPCRAIVPVSSPLCHLVRVGLTVDSAGHLGMTTSEEARFPESLAAFATLPVRGQNRAVPFVGRWLLSESTPNIAPAFFEQSRASLCSTASPRGRHVPTAHSPLAGRFREERLSGTVQSFYFFRRFKDFTETVFETHQSG